jgi:hypothetical protein
MNIEEKVSEIEKDLATNIAVIKNDIQYLKIFADDIKFEIYGNGRDGLKDKVDKLEGKIAIIAGLGSFIGSVLVSIVWKLIMK